jgi:proteasome lid subunit RPN8/RPN11
VCPSFALPPLWLLRAASRPAPGISLGLKGVPSLGCFVLRCPAGRPRSGAFREEPACSLARGEESNPAPFGTKRKTMNTINNVGSSETPMPAMGPLVKPVKFPSQPQEWKLISLRECPTPEQMQLLDTPDRAAAYWKEHVTQNPFFDPERECFAVFMLNTRRRIRGHQLVSTGTIDTLLVHPREVFRLAIAMNAAAIILAHNHPSGEASPSEADIKITRDLVRAGQLLKIEVLDHVIIGNPRYVSLREMGYINF